jgi:hypothetical protein
MESVYHIVTIRVNETSWAHVWRLHSRYLGTGYDNFGVTVAKISALEAFRGKTVFSGGFWGFSKILGVVGGSWHKR